MTTVATVSVAAPVGHTVADSDELGQTVEQNRHKQLYTAIDILEGLKDKEKGGEKHLKDQGDTHKTGEALQ